jgi:hypothetical protein
MNTRQATAIYFACLAVAMLGAAMLTGCVTPQWTPHVVRLESSPPGAFVSFQKGHFPDVEACQTPCEYDVRDYFGFMSQYTFTARKGGFEPAVLVFEEPTVFHAQGVVPATVMFKLEAMK